jgi:hypothetical protein
VATNGLPNIAGSELPLFLSTLIGELNWKPWKTLKTSLLLCKDNYTVYQL